MFWAKKSFVHFAVENCLGLAIRTGRAAGSVALTIDKYSAPVSSSDSSDSRPATSLVRRILHGALMQRKKTLFSSKSGLSDASFLRCLDFRDAIPVCVFPFDGIFTARFAWRPLLRIL